MNEKLPDYSPRPNFLDRALVIFNLFPEFNEAALAENPSEVMHTWRERALLIVVFASLIANLPLALAAVKGEFKIIPQWAANLVLMAYFPCIAFSLVRSIAFISRVHLILGAKAIVGAIQLITTQLVGGGRLTLAFLPVTALILGGTRAAGNMLLLCVFIIGSITCMMAADTAIPAAVHTDNITAGYWLFQFFVWIGGIVPQLYLMGHFLALQNRTVVAVSSARDKIDAEVARNRRLEYEINKIGEKERQKLGAELHDGLCQHLTATLLNCSTLEYRMKKSDSADLASIKKIREGTERAIALAYEVARGLCPVRIEQDSLIPALQLLCREIRQKSEIDCRIQADQGIKIPTSEAGLHLYRIAGEAIANAVKHSACSRIIVRLAGSENEIVLEISDNGHGMPSEKVFSKGMGLNIMQYRAHLIGGNLEIKVAEMGGTSVICRLPAVKENDE